jgi:hypothetical protein
MSGKKSSKFMKLHSTQSSVIITQNNEQMRGWLQMLYGWEANIMADLRIHPKMS